MKCMAPVLRVPDCRPEVVNSHYSRPSPRVSVQRFRFCGCPYSAVLRSAEVKCNADLNKFGTASVVASSFLLVPKDNTEM